MYVSFRLSPSYSQEQIGVLLFVLFPLCFSSLVIVFFCFITLFYNISSSTLLLGRIRNSFVFMSFCIHSFLNPSDSSVPKMEILFARRISDSIRDKKYLCSETVVAVSFLKKLDRKCKHISNHCLWGKCNYQISLLLAVLYFF